MNIKYLINKKDSRYINSSAFIAIALAGGKFVAGENIQFILV